MKPKMREKEREKERKRGLASSQQPPAAPRDMEVLACPTWGWGLVPDLHPRDGVGTPCPNVSSSSHISHPPAPNIGCRAHLEAEGALLPSPA